MEDSTTRQQGMYYVTIYLIPSVYLANQYGKDYTII